MIEVLISTYNDNIIRAINVPLLPKEGVCYLICHQVTDEYIPSLRVQDCIAKLISIRNDIRYIKFNNFGLSKNRNNCLDNISSDAKYVYICDDDIRLQDDFDKIILMSFSNEWDVLTFKILSDNDLPFKKYPVNKCKHSLKTLLAVSSVEVVIKSSLISRTNIKFDERFGLGALYSASEENIFLIDLYRQGARIGFIPKFICYHPFESSGKNWSNKLMAFSKGAFFKRVFGTYLGLMILIVFSFKKYNEYKKFHSLTSFTTENIKSFLSFKC